MIHAILVINNHGQPRLSKFYDAELKDPKKRESLVREAFNLVSRRADTACSIIEDAKGFGKGAKLIYRSYATLYFVFIVSPAESELGILDLIQVFVEALDKCFENVCELDLIFHLDRVEFILDELVMAGCVCDTSLPSILAAVQGAQKHEQVSKQNQKRSSVKGR